MPLRGAASSDVEADTGGTVLMVGEANAGGVGAVQRRDPTTGALLASHPTAGIAAPFVAAVTPSYVWIAESTGMMGYVQQLDARSLAPSPADISGCTEHPSPTCIAGTNGITAMLAEGLIWVTQTLGGNARNYCAYPTTGQVLAPVELPEPEQDYVQAIGQNQIYYTTDASGSEQLRQQPIPTACRAT